MTDEKEMAQEQHKEGAEPETGAGRQGGADSVHAEGGEGARNAEATPDISVEGEHGQTSAPADDDEEGQDAEETRRQE
jgi:hypothetical protein